jgi:hypothetical protein
MSKLPPKRHALTDPSPHREDSTTFRSFAIWGAGILCGLFLFLLLPLLLTPSFVQRPRSSFTPWETLEGIGFVKTAAGQLIDRPHAHARIFLHQIPFLAQLEIQFMWQGDRPAPHLGIRQNIFWTDYKILPPSRTEQIGFWHKSTYYLPLTSAWQNKDGSFDLMLFLNKQIKLGEDGLISSRIVSPLFVRPAIARVVRAKVSGEDLARLVRRAASRLAHH